MNIELSNHEIEMIDKSLTAWDREVQTDAMMGGLFGVMLSGKDEKQDAKDKFTAENKAATEESAKRKRSCVMLRAKLYQAQAKASEHETVDERPIA